MAKTIVNKHFDNKELVNREQFHENEQYAKGELLIVNEQNPSIYVLNSDGVPMPISSGIEVVNTEINNIKQTISDNEKVTAAALVDLDVRIESMGEFNSVLNRLAILEEENEALKQKVNEMEILINEMSK